MKNLLLATTALLAIVAVALAQTANISTTSLDPSGTTTNAGLQNAASPTYFTNDGQTVLIIQGGGGPSTARVKTQAHSISQNGYGSAPLSDEVIQIPSGTLVVAGPFPPGRWNDPMTGLVQVDFSSPTTTSATAKTLAR